MSISNRENCISMFKRKGYEFAPIDFSLTPYQQEVFKQKTGNNSLREYFNFPYEYVHQNLQVVDKSNYMKYYKTPLKPGTEIDSVGVAHEPGSEASMHMTRLICPLDNVDDINIVKDYPFPTYESSFSTIKEKVDIIKKNGNVATVGMEMTIWETAWSIMGMENLMMDMMEDGEISNYIFDKVLEMQLVAVKSLAYAGVDMFKFGDDIGMQKTIMMSHDLYCKWIKPRMEKIIKAVKTINPEVLVQYHSCGYVEPFISDLIEIGVDILNPVQPECMDFAEIHKKYGDKISFSGTIGTQTVMPFGTAEEVAENVKKNLDIAGKKGGLLCCPTHVIEPEVPWENIIAYVEACRNYKPN